MSSSEEEDEEEESGSVIPVMQTHPMSPNEKFKQLPMQRITEVSRESGTFEEEETEHLDRRSLSIMQRHMSEVLRLQVEHFQNVLKKGTVFNSIDELEKKVIKPANAIATSKGFKQNLYIKKY